MDFSLSDEQSSLVGLARQILDDSVTHERLVELESSGWAVYDAALWRRLAGAGLTGIAVPEASGGAGQGFFEIALLAEQVGRYVAPVPLVWTLVTAHVLAQDAPAVAAPVLGGVAEGTTVVTAALEPGPDVAATREGKQWRLAGERGFVAWAPVADIMLVPAVDGNGTPVAALVDRDAPGLAITELHTTNREPQAALSFDGTPVADDRLIPDAGELLESLRQHLTAGLCMVAAGVCGAALERTARHTSTREQFGKPIATFQAVAQRAADAYIDTELIRLTALQAAWRLAEDWPAAEEVAVAKWWAGDGGMRVLHACQHLHGGLGVDLDYPLHRYFLWGKQLEHELGTPTRQLLHLGAQLADAPV